jgi:hypothetical protein
MRKSLVVLILVVGACSSGETSDSTTSSTAVSATSTTTDQTSTTLSPASTATTVPTTTTSSLATTTTTGLEGTWADEPLVTTGFGALGWWDGSDWRVAAEEASLPVDGGENYQVVRLGDLGMTTAGPEATVCEPLGIVGVELAEPELLGDFPGPYGVAISAPWTMQPFLFEEIADDGSYAGFAAELLSSRGLDVANPVIKQLFRTDLEGDGVNEVLVVAEEVPQDFIMEPGDYSIAFMRKVVDGEVQMAILHETVALDEEDTFDGAHSFGGVADLNDDGKMELITNSAFFEGFNVTIWEYVNDDLGPSEAMQTGCGS